MTDYTYFFTFNLTAVIAINCLTFSSLSPAQKSLCLKPATHLAILYADRRGQRKSPRVPGVAIAIFANRRDRRINSPMSGMSVKPATHLAILSHDFSRLPHGRDRRKKSSGVSASIGGENRLRFSLAIKFAAIGV